ncbi:MAG: lysophospholipase, partial [Alphaproteobacteria bacterium]
KYTETIGELTARGFDVWSMDWRGQGASGRALENPQKGHIDRFETYLADLTWFVDTIIGARDGEGETLLMAHSMGGHITLRAVLEGRIKPDRFILSAPMIDLPMQGISRYAITALCSAMAGIDLGSRYVAGTGDYDPARVKFDGNPLTGDRKRFDAIHAAIAANPVVAMGGPTFGWLNATFRSVRVLRNLAQQSPRTCPILLFTAMSDTVVSVTAQTAMNTALPDCEQVQVADARHEILHETDAIRRQFWEAFDGFTSAG